MYVVYIIHIISCQSCFSSLSLFSFVQSLAVDATTHELQPVDRHAGGTRCIVLVPTRELALQTLVLAEKLCSHSFSWLVPGCLSGGEKRKSEKARIRKGLSLLIATPGRLLDHLTKTESLLMSLKGKLEWLVLDEADRLLDMGLGGQVQQIVQHVRANQPKSGVKRNGVTWNSILVSATVTPKVQELGKSMLGGDEWLWARARGGNDEHAAGTSTTLICGNNETREYNDESTKFQLTDSTPRQLGQLHITVSAKLRLATLIAFLVQRVKKDERTVVFMSTCDGVDYHEALFTEMASILSNDNDDDDNGIFGKACPIYKLHGNVPHAERNSILRKFGQGANGSSTNGRAALLLATDVAARGLNLPGVDWTVQYDPPCEVADYAHRAGRAARAGKGGHSLLFLLPSERAFLDVLEMKGCQNMTALSLTSTLNEAAKICGNLQQDGEKRSGGGYGTNKAGRSGEAFCAELQHRLEGCVMEDTAKAKADAASAAKAAALASGGGKRTRKKPNKEKVEGRLLEMARSAYTSYLRSYPTKEKAVRHIFSARALHLGHVARSFALKEPPKALVKAQVRSEATHASFMETEGRKRKSKALTFQDPVIDDSYNDSEIAQQIISKRPKHTSREVMLGADKRVDNKQARSLLHARAIRLQGMDAM
jgi:ATP-dependent RNA helicase DDX31/DBP7